MNKRYTTLGTDVLDTSDYSIIAEAKTNELAQEIADKMNEAATIAQLREVATAARELVGSIISDNKMYNIRVAPSTYNAVTDLAAALAALEQEQE